MVKRRDEKHWKEEEKENFDELLLTNNKRKKYHARRLRMSARLKIT